MNQTKNTNVMNYENEVWKPVVGYEGYYEVSDIGRVRSLYFRKIKMHKQYINKQGYCVVWLALNAKQKVFQVHRLVYNAFKESLKEGLVIDHIDGNPLNNTLSNLRQITQRENTQAGYDRKRITCKMSSRYPGVTKFVQHGLTCFKVSKYKITIAIFRCEAIAGFVAKMVNDGTIPRERLKCKLIRPGKKPKGCGQA